MAQKNDKVKTLVVLTEGLRERLAAEAERRTCSVSLLVREFCSRCLEQSHSDEKREAA